MSKTKAIVYTDGSCNPNPGPGGWGFVSLVDGLEWHMNGGEKHTTNNRMELMAVIKALEFHKSDDTIYIYTDRLLCLKCATGVWKRKKNGDLWRMYDTLRKGKHIVWHKVKAHSGDHYNEIVDDLAKDGARENGAKIR